MAEELIAKARRDLLEEIRFAESNAKGSRENLARIQRGAKAELGMIHIPRIEGLPASEIKLQKTEIPQSVHYPTLPRDLVLKARSLVQAAETFEAGNQPPSGRLKALLNRKLAIETRYAELLRKHVKKLGE